jgi:predicted TIM-barrel fold metal-dependent hydrolase
MLNADDLILVSVDDHVVEPADLFDAHVPAALRDVAPRVVRREDGSDAWLFQNQLLPLGHVGPDVGFRPGIDPRMDTVGEAPTAFDELRPGCYDIHARIDDMNANGQVAAMCFPQFARFSGQVFTEAADKELSLRMLQAYNDWHVYDWAGSYPGRIIPLGVVPMWDAELMAAEVRRLADMGCRAVTYSISPFRLGLPSLHSEVWDPFWEACCDTGTVVCMHLGSDSTPVTTSSDAPLNVRSTLAPLSTVFGAVDLIWSHVLRRYPVRIALSEGGIGWIPWMLERIDHSLLAQSFTKQDFGGRRPSDVFKEHIVACFIDDPHGIKSRHEVGVENICIEVDYPHSDSSWPRTPELILEQLANVPDDEIQQMTHLNAMRVFHFELFDHIARQDCTVGALRSKLTASALLDTDVTVGAD